MPARRTALIKVLELLIEELIKKGYKVEFQSSLEKGYIKWKLNGE